ncbi:MAG: pyruvate carboxylase subunit B, partial [Pseudomonadota bacterium]
MAGLLKPYDCEQLIKGLKETVSIPIAMQCHATTGLSTATYQKAIDAGIDMLDTAISSMSMTYGHSATETIVSIVEGTERDTGLDLNQLEEIAAYFRDVRKKYAAFEGSLKGVDGRILLAQVPGGMLTNMENQLKEQGAADKLDQVLLEIPRVREDLGYIPLVTPTSQIVGTQAVLNVLTGERYKTITKETAGVLKGEYGATPAPMNKELQERVLEGAEAITCRPADKLEPELEKLEAELLSEAKEQGLELADDVIDDVLTYALFPQIGLKFIKNRNNPDAFEAIPTGEVAKPEATPAASSPVKAEQYSVKVDGKVYDVVVAQGGELKEVTLKDSELIPQSASASAGETLNAPLAGNIFKVKVKPGQTVNEGDVVIIMEAMKMETEIRAAHSGTVAEVLVAEGDSVATGDALIALA